jgi:dienelactone hydrolase
MVVAMRLAAIALLAIASAGCGGHDTISISASPRAATSDVPVTIHVRGLEPQARAVVELSGTSTGGGIWRGQIVRRADAHGALTLQDAYLYPWMRPVRGGLGAWPRQVTIRVQAGHSAAHTTVERVALDANSVAARDLRPAGVGFYGEWLTPRHRRAHGAVLMFGGSEGGLENGSLALAVAAHGYPVLQLAYFGEPGLRQSLRQIPLEYFEHALRWLARQPQVDRARIVTWGWSRGGEASLLLASTFPRLVHAAVGYVPSAYVFGAPADVRVAAWTYRGRPLRMQTRNGRLQPSGLIPVWKSSGPLFVVGGGDDGLWPSGAFVRQIEQELHRHARRDVTALSYPRAGHMLYQAIPPQIDTKSADYGHVQTNYGVADFGGSYRADEAALEDSWPKLLRFLATVAQ